MINKNGSVDQRNDITSSIGDTVRSVGLELMDIPGVISVHFDKKLPGEVRESLIRLRLGGFISNNDMGLLLKWLGDVIE